MRLDKKHYPPIGLLEGGNIRLDIQDSMSSIWKNCDVSKKVMYDLILEGKKYECEKVEGYVKLTDGKYVENKKDTHNVEKLYHLKKYVSICRK